MSAERLLTTAELADHLGITPNAIHQRVHKGSIPYRKLGPHRQSPLRFSLTEIEAWSTP